MATLPKSTGKKKESLFDSIINPFTWVVREAAMPDTMLRLARGAAKKKGKK
jgi:hypothetical protein